MLPVTQTFFGDGSNNTIIGDCFRACVASILELPIEEVPHFMEIAKENNDWWVVFTNWLATHNLFAIEIKLQDPKASVVISPNTWCILSGKGPRGIMHSVVGYYQDNGLFILEHDPHPSNRFLKDNPPEWGMFICKNPVS